MPCLNPDKTFIDHFSSCFIFSFTLAFVEIIVGGSSGNLEILRSILSLQYVTVKSWATKISELVKPINGELNIP